MCAADTEFLRLLKKDIDYFERAIERFEELVRIAQGGFKKTILMALRQRWPRI